MHLKSLAFFVLLAAGMLPGPQSAAATGMPDRQQFLLFLLAGQSNMAGRGYLKDLDPADRAPDARVLALNAAGEWQPAMDPLHWDKPKAAGVGIGKFFGRIVTARTPGIVAGLIPAACGGSPISVWEPGRHFSQTDSNPYDDAIARARRAMKDGTLAAILWHQGESDCNARNAPLYEARLEALIKRFRTDLNAPGVPFIIGQMGRFSGKKWTAAQTEVDRAQQEVAAKMENVYYVGAEGLVSRGDNLHFSTASQKIFAERYADAYLKASAKK